MSPRNTTKADIVLKNFWKDNAHFADLFNAVLFDGEQKLHPEDLREADVDLSGMELHFVMLRNTWQSVRNHKNSSS